VIYDIIVILNGFHDHSYNVVGGDFRGFVVLVFVRVVNLLVNVGVIGTVGLGSIHVGTGDTVILSRDATKTY